MDVFVNIAVSVIHLHSDMPFVFSYVKCDSFFIEGQLIYNIV